jgi:hypothetical protein
MPRLYKLALLVAIYLLLNVLGYTFRQQENMIGTHIFADGSIIVALYGAYQWWRMDRQLLER